MISLQDALIRRLDNPSVIAMMSVKHNTEIKVKETTPSLISSADGETHADSWYKLDITKMKSKKKD
jgi:hypothetical protein